MGETTMKLFDRITGKADPSRLAGQIAEAEARIAAAHTTRGQLALAFENGTATEADLARIEAELATLKARVDRLRAAHAAALTIEAAKSSDALQAERKAQDDAILAQFDALAAKAKSFAKLADGYAAGYRDLLAAADAARAGLSTNPRARSDLALALDVPALVSTELTRLSPSILPPGANAVARTLGDPAKLTSLTDHIAALRAAVLKREPGHV